MSSSVPLRRTVGESLAEFARGLREFLGYQVLTRLLLAVVVLPTFAFLTWLLVDRYAAVANGNLVAFLFSPRGLAYLAALAALVVVAAVVELVGLIVISGRHHRGLPPAGFVAVLRHGFGRLPRLAGLGSIPLLLALALAAPLTGATWGVSVTQGLRIPNFVTSVVWATPHLAVAYVAVVVVLALALAAISLTFHGVVLGDLGVTRALTTSVRVVGRGIPRYLRLVVAPSLAATAGALAVVAVWWGIILTLIATLNAEAAGTRVLLLALLLIQQLVTVVAALVVVPLHCHLLTRLWYAAAASDPALSDVANRVPDLPARSGASWLDRVLRRPRTLAALTLLGVVALAAPLGLVFNDVMRIPPTALVAAHRAGGDLGPENSLGGLRAAIAEGVAYVEVDVQRTADGAYVLNHDDDFARAAGVKKKSSELTLAQIKALDISLAKDGSERVPTAEEFLVEARGRTKVILELKGATADQKMADDMADLVRSLGMSRDVIVMGLDQRLIEYVVSSHADLPAGFVYYRSLGDSTRLAGEYAVIEEDEASDERLAALLAAGKKPIVWTVNERADMIRFAARPVHALITDHVRELNGVLAEPTTASSADLLLRLFTEGE